MIILLPLRHIIAEPLLTGLGAGIHPPGWFPVPEGPAFDRDGSLWFVNAFGDENGAIIHRFDTATGALEGVFSGDHKFASLVPHRDGRLWLAELGNGLDGGGRLASISPDGTDLRTEVDQFAGTPVVPDDLVFDASGNLYYNDFQGSLEHPNGRVIRRTPDGEQTLVAEGLAHPNGIALNTDQTRLFVSDHLTNRLLSWSLDGEGRGTDGQVHAYLNGGRADSTTIDTADNIYQASFGGGRVDVFNRFGTPIAFITPLSDDPYAEYPLCTHVAIRPGDREGILLAGGEPGIGVFRFETLAPGQVPFSHLAP
jgi:lactonase